MRLVVQRSGKSSVSVDGSVVGKIDFGLVVLVGFTYGDNEEDIDYLIDKLINLRIFEDNDGKMNLSLLDIEGSILSISQFTLYADSSKGRRPSFVNSLNYNDAEKLYKIFNKKLQEKNINVATGVFGVSMVVNIENNGPVTIILESREASDKK